MVLVELTSIDLSDLPMDAFKAHLQLGTGFADDSVQDEVLESYIRAAISAIEARIGKMLLSRDVVWELSSWSGASEQALPVAPVSAITGLATVDKTGSETEIDLAHVSLRKDTHRPKMLSAGAGLPTIPAGGAVRISFTAGFGPSWIDVPPDLREAVFLLAANYYENRRDQSGAGGLMPFGVMALLEAHRNIRVFGAR
ncbi:MAG: phage head-tail connector protein [Pseudomonadota bacterium]